MVSARTARRIATTAAYGGGSVGLAATGLYGLLRIEAGLARRAIGAPAKDPPAPDGRYGFYDGEPISVVVIGDSSAAGVGVATADETPGALVAAGLAEIAERPVQLTVVARTGARTSDLADLILRAEAARPDLAVEAAEGARVLYKSLKRLLELPDGGEVHPRQVSGSRSGSESASRSAATFSSTAAASPRSTAAGAPALEST